MDFFFIWKFDEIGTCHPQNRSTLRGCLEDFAAQKPTAWEDRIWAKNGKQYEKMVFFHGFFPNIPCQMILDLYFEF